MTKETMKKEHTEKCPTCNQWWTQEIEVEMPDEGMTIYIDKKGNDKFNLLIVLLEPILSENKGNNFAVEDVNRSVCDKVIATFIQNHHKDNTFVTIYEDNKVSASTHRRRDSLSLTDPLSERSIAIVKKMRRKRRHR